MPALVLGCGGSELFTSGKVGGYLYQADAGLPTFIRLTMTNGSINPADVHAWLIYRGPSPGFPAEADSSDYLVAVLRASEPIFYDDDAQYRAGLSAAFTFTYLGYDGQETATVNIAYNHLALTAGQTYYYKFRRIVDPNIVIPPPAQTAQVGVGFEVDPSSAVGQPSPAVGPITYLEPVTLLQPSDGVRTVNPNVIDFSWQPTSGATDYRLEVSASRTNWQGLAYRADEPHTGGLTIVHRFQTSGTSPFKSTQPYYWRVGARVAGQRAPVSGSSRGYIYSQVRSFWVPPMPPPL